MPPRMLVGMGWLACRPGCWLVWGGWYAAPDVGWYGVVGMPTGFLRLMIRFTHTTQPTPVDVTVYQYHPTYSG